MELENNILSKFIQANTHEILHVCSYVDPSFTYLDLYAYFVVQVEAMKLERGH